MTNTILVTGGATGIGHALLERLLAEDHQLINVDLRPCGLEGVIDVHCDLADPGSIAQAIEALPESIDGIVHVAGVAPAMVSELTVMQVNFLGMRELNEKLLPRLSHRGRIVIVASSIGRDWRDNAVAVEGLLDCRTFASAMQWLEAHTEVWEQVAYKFSKQCAAAYTYRAAGLAKAQQVNVNCVNPGIVETRLSPWFRDLVGPDVYDHINAQVGRPGQPHDIAGLIRFLLSDDAQWVNGVEITADGGYHAGVVGGWLEPARPQSDSA